MYLAQKRPTGSSELYNNTEKCEMSKVIAIVKNLIASQRNSLHEVEAQKTVTYFPNCLIPLF